MGGEFTILGTYYPKGFLGGEIFAKEIKSKRATIPTNCNGAQSEKRNAYSSGNQRLSLSNAASNTIQKMMTQVQERWDHMTVVKPKPEHPWRRGFPKTDEQKWINQTIVNPYVNNWKVSGALPPWNGNK